jgi:hypothetical protein
MGQIHVALTNELITLTSIRDREYHFLQWVGNFLTELQQTSCVGEKKIPIPLKRRRIRVSSLIDIAEMLGEAIGDNVREGGIR